MNPRQMQQMAMHMQRQMAKIQEELKTVEVVGSAGSYITVTANGDYGLQGKLIADHTAAALSEALQAQIRGDSPPVLIISADALSSHQSVITAVDAARMAGISHITFALQAPQGAPRR